MPTHNPRINVTFDPSIVAILVSMAKHKHISLSGLTKELVLEALEKHEDSVLSAIADARDKMHTKTIKHDDAWK